MEVGKKISDTKRVWAMKRIASFMWQGCGLKRMIIGDHKEKFTICYLGVEETSKG